MIGDDDFFMQNSDYHYGASDSEKLYGRDYDDYEPGYSSSSYSSHSNNSRSYSSNRHNSSSYSSSSYGGYDSKSSSDDDGLGKMCIAGLAIIIVLALLIFVAIPAITSSMENTVSVENLTITRYVQSIEFDSKLSANKGYEVSYIPHSYGKHYMDVIFYSKNGEILYDSHGYVGDQVFEDVPQYFYFDGEADYAVFEVSKHPFSSPIYSERVNVDNRYIKSEHIDLGRNY